MSNYNVSHLNQLEADVYFKTIRKDQNLDRSRNQFALAQQLEDCESEMAGYLKNLLRMEKVG